MTLVRGKELAMDESILNSIKKLLGPGEEYNHFDQDIIMHINSVFVILYQLGVGLKSFMIEDDSATWSDYLDDWTNLNLIKTYIYLKVRLMFDPPSSSSVMEAIKENIRELEWRINVEVDPPKEETT